MEMKKENEKRWREERRSVPVYYFFSAINQPSRDTLICIIFFKNLPLDGTLYIFLQLQFNTKTLF